MLYLAYSLVFDSLRDVGADPDEIDETLGDLFLGPGLKYYIPELTQAMGITGASSDGVSNALIKRFLSCRNVMGVIPSATGVNSFSALTLLGCDFKTNTIEFSSPYFYKIALLSRRDSFLLDKAGKFKEGCGEFLTRPSNSRLIRVGILKEQNRRVIEIIHAIVTAVERTGNTPLITPGTSSAGAPVWRRRWRRSAPDTGI